MAELGAFILWLRTWPETNQAIQAVQLHGIRGSINIAWRFFRG